MARVTFSTMYDTTMRYLQRNANSVNKLQEQMSSNKMINRPSDNPVGFANAMIYRNTLNSLSQQKINMDDGEIYMTVLETTHQSINTVFVRCKELAVQAASDTQNHQNRLYTNMEVRQLLEQMVSDAQSKHKDNYIFSGKWTNQPPYEIKGGQAELRLNADNSNRNTPLNPTYNPMDPSSPVFDPDSTVTINIFDSNFWDQNLSPVDNPNVQRIIPGTVQLSGLLETPYGNKSLPEDHPDYDKPDYEVDYVNGTITLMSSRAKELFYDPSTGAAVTTTNSEGTEIVVSPTISFEYIYRNSIDMSGEIYREIDSGITIKINTNPDDLFGKDHEMDSFKQIISLMQGLWYNDQHQISKSMDYLDNGRERNLEQQAVEGARLNRVAMVYDRNYDLTNTNTDAQSRIEDVKWEDLLSQMALADTIYNVSLQAAARIMQRSLVDYLR